MVRDTVSIPRATLPLRPLAFGLALALASFGLFAWRIGTPASLYFDETHYVPAARALIARSGPTNIEHPLFAKTMIAAGIMLLGDGPLGWRLPSALFASVGVAAFFWIAWLMFRTLRTAILATLLLVFDQTLFVQARIAMLEIPMTAFLLLGAGCFLAARRSERAPLYEYLGSVALGLAIGAKWLAIPYALLLLGAAAWARFGAAEYHSSSLVDRVIPETAKLLAVVLVVYLATFWPAFLYQHEPMRLGHLIGFQFEMLQAQEAPLAPHPYQSTIWQWLLMLRPIWYFFGKQAGGYQAVLLVGNPVVYWGGLAAVLVALGLRRKLRTPNLKVTVAVYLFSVGVWIVIPKPIGFFFYYNLSAIALCLVIAALCEALGPRGLRVLGWTTAFAGAFFMYFYPIISAETLPADNTWTDWVWFKSWY